VQKRKRTQTYANSGDTEANAAGRIVRTRVARKSKSLRGKCWERK